MKKVIKKYITFILVFLISVSVADVKVCAAEKALFNVQASEVSEDVISVSVYLTNAYNIGGIEAKIVYDPTKVSYISSGLGSTFSDGFGETHCTESEATVKCVAVYTEAKTAHGELMYARFKLKEGESYQPQFQVINLMDASKDIKAIPYKISYQQADGAWKENPDNSGEKAPEKVIEQTRREYGSEEDQKQGSRVKDELDSNGSEEKVEKTKTAEDYLKENPEAEKYVKELEKLEKEQSQGTEKTLMDGKLFFALAGGILLIGIVLWAYIRRKK